MEAVLVMFKADGSRHDFPLAKPRTVVGRTNTCDLRIPLSSVSRQHCELRLEDSAVIVRDLGSSNGTFHNGSRVTESRLSAGDEIVIGPVVFTLVVDGHPSEITAVRTIIDDSHQPEGVPPAPQPAEAPQELPVAQHEDDAALPAVEEEHYTPTVDLDDPIAALAAMSDNDAPTGDAEQEDDVFVLADDESEEEIPLIFEDDDDAKA